MLIDEIFANNRESQSEIFRIFIDIAHLANFREFNKKIRQNYSSLSWHDGIDKRRQPQTMISCHGNVDRTR